MSRRRRSRRSAEEWAVLVAEYRAGSEDDAEFCKRHDLSHHTFRRYKYRNGTRRRPASSQGTAFAQVRITPPASAGHIIVHGVDGVKVEVPASVGMVAVAELVRALQRGR